MPAESAVDPTKTIRDRLRESMAATVARKPIKIDVPNRPGFVVQFKLMDPLRDDVKMAEFTEQTGADKDNPPPDAFIRAAALLVIDCCTEIWSDGEQWVDDDGKPVTFAHKDFRDAIGEANWIDAVFAFYGGKADVATVSEIIATRSGMTGRAKETPTKG